MNSIYISLGLLSYIVFFHHDFFLKMRGAIFIGAIAFLLFKNVYSNPAPQTLAVGCHTQKACDPATGFCQFVTICD